VMTNRGWILSILLLFLAVGIADAADFTADLVICEGKIAKEGKIFVKGEDYRMELKEPRGPDVVVQMFPGKDLCRVLVPRYSLYAEAPRSDRMTGSMDPFLAAEGMKKHFKCVEAGTEEWAGRSCKKEEFRYGDDVTFIRLTDTELGFPLKLKMVQQEGYYTELRNLKVEAVAEALFAIPEGYEKSDFETIAERVSKDPEMKAKRKAWADRQPKKTDLNAHMGEKNEFRALLGDNLSIKVSGKSGGRGECTWSVTPMKGDEALPTREFTGKGEIDFAPDSGVNRIILRTIKGQLWGKIEISGLGMLVKATRHIEQRDSGGGRSSSVRADVTRVTIRVKSLEVPGESQMAVRLSVTWELPQAASGENEEIKHRLEPGEEKTFEKVGAGVIEGYDVTLIGPGGRGEVTITVDYRPEGEQKPF
jgi:hypothetical protein